jgi:hypothetical protein
LTADRPETTDLQCITQDTEEPAATAYQDICAGTGDHIARSHNCPPDCGGHLICGPCYQLAHHTGWLTP